MESGSELCAMEYSPVNKYYVIRISRNILILLCLVFLCTASSAQIGKPNLRHYSVDAGLPSSEVHSIVQDDSGNLWIATDRGVARYDGYTFHSYGVNEGLSDNAILRMKKDYKGRVWMVGFSGRLFYTEGNVIKAFQYNDQVVKFGKGTIPIDIVVDSLDKVFVSFTYHGVISVDRMGRVRFEYQYVQKTLEKNHFSLYETGPSGYIRSTNYLSGYISEKYFHVSASDNKTDVLLGKFGGGNFGSLESSSGTYISINDHLYEYKDGKMKLLLLLVHSKILSMYEGDGLLWLGTIDGVLAYKVGDFNHPVYSFLSKLSVSAITKDFENGYWFSTLENGIYYYPVVGIRNLKFDDTFSNCATSIFSQSDSEFYIGYKGGMIGHISKDQVTWIYTQEPQWNNLNIYSFFKPENSDTILVGAEVPGGIVHDHFFEFNKGRRLAVKGDFVRSPNGKLYVYGATEFLCLMDGKLDTVGGMSTRVSGLVFNTADECFFGTMNGIESYNFKTREIKNVFNELKGLRIEDIRKSGESIFVASQGKGVVICKNNIFQYINSASGLISDLINKIYIDDQDVWCSTNKGISRISLNDQKIPAGFDVENITMEDGLISNEINQVVRGDNNIFVATKDGVSILDAKKKYRNLIPPFINITSFEVNHRQHVLSSFTDLSHDESNLKITYNGISFRSNGQLLYRYLLIKNSDTIESVTPNRSIEFPALSPGNYHFEVTALNTSGISSSAPDKLDFVIHPAWWNTNLFRVFILILFAGLSYLVYRNRLARNASRYQMEMKQASLRLTALRSQMNPHFIFNVMDSIRNYMMENNTQSAEKYLTSFARLVRYTLEQSDKQECTLEEELNMLRIYIELEKERFSKLIEVTIHVNENVETSEIMVPTMILQPFIENAFKHGLRNSSKDGFLKIEVSGANDLVTVIIEDNGVVKEKNLLSSTLKKENSQSYGISLVQKRIESYNKAYGRNVKFQIIQLQNSGGEKCGTRIVLEF